MNDLKSIVELISMATQEIRTALHELQRTGVVESEQVVLHFGDEGWGVRFSVTIPPVASADQP